LGWQHQVLWKNFNPPFNFEGKTQRILTVISKENETVLFLGMEAFSVI